jgi:hypothetical protein
MNEPARPGPGVATCGRPWPLPSSPTKGTDTPASGGNVVTIGLLVTLRRRPRRAEPCVQDRKVDTGTSMCRAASGTEYSGGTSRSGGVLVGVLEVSVEVLT